MDFYQILWELEEVGKLESNQRLLAGEKHIIEEVLHVVLEDQERMQLIKSENEPRT